MKKFIPFFISLLMVSASFAQSEKYMKAMEPLVAALDTTMNRDELASLANSFERIATAEKTQWLPFYYAALADINAGYTYMDNSFGDKSSDVDPYADRAEKLIKQAEDLSKDNSEIWVLKKMHASLSMIANVMARYQEYGPKAATALETAKKLNPENPRVYMLEGEDLILTPEQYGGDKAEGKKRLEMAIAKFQVAKPASSIEPQWGLRATNYFLSQAK